MESLATLASRRVPLTQIWEEGVLNEPLPNEQLRQLRDRITLDSLYHGGLINEDINIGLFAFAVEKSIPNLVWSYIGLVLNRPIYHPASPFSKEGEDYAEKIRGIKPNYFIEARKQALSVLATELTQFLEESGIPHDYGNVTIVWSHANNPNGQKPLWKVLAIRITPGPQDEDEAAQQDEFGVPNPVQVNFFATLDEIMAFIFQEMDNQGVVTTLIHDNQSQGVNELESDYQAALNGMRNGLQADTESIWEMLEGGIITLSGNFQLSLEDFKEQTRLVVIDDFLYIIVVESNEDIYEQNVSRGSYYLYYQRDDALLILSSLFLTGNAWNLDTDPIFDQQPLSEEVN